MSLPAVPLHDVDDAEGFVRATLRRHLGSIPHDDKEEMVMEGLVILCDLARRYDPAKDGVKPKKPGHVCKGPRCCVPSFAGYASYLLHRKMLDAWHRMHPEHQLRTQPDGTRKYVYYPKPASIDERSGGSYQGEGARTSDTLNPLDKPGTRQPGNFVPVEPKAHVRNEDKEVA